jgi:hypothetical protein
MNCGDEDARKCFGLEIARLLLHASFRELRRVVMKARGG